MLFMVMQLIGCSANNSPPQTQIIYTSIPLPLIMDCHYPVYIGKKWKEVAEYARRLQLILDECQLQIDALKEYEADTKQQ